jgi:rubrerythrin
MFEGMSKGEGQHKAVLSELHKELTGQDGEPTPPPELGGQDTMEGGISKADALSWIERGAIDALELTAAMEANAYDRYIRIGRGLGGDPQRVFVELAEAEKVHLDRLMEAFSEALSAQR